ncbi:MAG: response regulator [Bacteroidetes bacterium]|nr:response regulator [Bacteroidota bacterium]
MKLSITLVLSTLFTFFVLMLIFGGYQATSYITSLDKQSNSLYEKEFAISQLTSEIVKHKEVIDANVKSMIIIPSSLSKMEVKGKIDKGLEEIALRTDRLMHMEDAEGKTTLEQIMLAFSDFSRALNKDYFLSYNKSLKSGMEKKPVIAEQGESQVDLVSFDISKKVDELLMKYTDHNSTHLENNEKLVMSSYSSIRNLILIFAVILFLFGIIVFVSVMRFVYSQVGVEPVVLREITRKITEGDLSVQFPPVTHGIYSSVKILNETMREVAENAGRIANGDFSMEIKPRSENDQLGNSLKKMVQTLTELQKVTDEISQGNFDRKIEVKGDNDLVSKSINLMSGSLEKNEKVNKEQNWLKDGLNKLSAELSGDQDLEQITSKAISFVGRYILAGRGVIYRYNESKKTMNLVSSFAFTERDNLSNLYELGNGVIGQVALEKKPILLRSLPKEEAPITTGTSSSLPCNTYTFPLLYEDELIGVIELASLLPFTSVQMEFLDQSNQVIASGIFTAIQKSKIEELLTKAREAQREAEEKTMMVQEANARLEEQQQQIQQQTEELQQSNSQLEEQQQQLQQQSEELQQTNAQLEEQQQILMKQTEDLQQGNDNLQQAKEDLDRKANDLELSNKYKSDFLANMSHELRTPLNSIILLSKMMQKNERGNLEKEDIKRAKVVHSAGEELLRLINDILDISKIEAGKTILSVSEFQTEDLVNELMHFFSSMAKNKGLTISVEDNLKTTITTDKDKVSQVLRNFISNALKFTKSGNILLRVGDSGNPEKPIKLSVLDTGIGIDAAKHKMIFDAFQQVDSSISREFGGTGLGLTISQKLAGLLHGEISLESELEKGSEFSLILPKVLKANEGELHEIEKLQFKLPVRRDEFPGISMSVATSFTDDRKKIKPGDKVILIVEDDLTFSDIVAMVITRMKMKVLRASTAEDGLNLVQQYKVNGIILDLVLPDMNGVDFMRRLKSYKELRHIPVQIISGHEKNPELMRMGALDFLQKPVDQEQIRQAIQGILNFSEKSPKDLLLVEDNAVHREALSELIKSQNIRVQGVETEEQAIEELNKGIYDAVIIDLGLKSGNGMNICKYAREKQMKVPIIVYTGKQLSPEEEKNLKKIADRIIIKTVHSENRLLDELMLFLHQTQKESSDKPEASDLSMKMKRLSNRTILVVDDDIKNVFVMSTALEEHGAKVVDAQNGQEALDLLVDKSIDLVLMDIMMPVMDGYTAIKKIRENVQTRGLPVIALTAKALKEDREKCIAAGADDYLAKPVDYDMLIGLVEAWCQKKM